MSRNDGGSAFPVEYGSPPYRRGMSLRDWFAGMALQGCVQSLTATDGMARDLLDFVAAVAGENRPSREWAVRLRAALTAALEGKE